jgi:transcriptional regulator EpsA
VLICALRDGKPLSFRVDSFSTTAADPGILAETFVRDASVAPTLVKVWEEGRFRPVVVHTGNGGPLPAGAFARELGRIGATQLVAHGTHDPDGLVCSFFLFGCTSATVAPGQSYLAQLVVPFLHSAWMRAQVAGRTKCDDGLKAAAGTHITPREQEILRWMYLGKSNPEIGTILNISTFTAKNHVQTILRKLNVVSRAQAVGKALELRILSLDGGVSGLVVPRASGSAQRSGKVGRAEEDGRVAFM